MGLESRDITCVKRLHLKAALSGHVFFGDRRSAAEPLKVPVILNFLVRCTLVACVSVPSTSARYLLTFESFWTG